MGLIHWWQLDDDTTWVDKITETVSTEGGTVTNPAGKIGNCAAMSSQASNYISSNVPNIFTNHTYSISAWIYVNSGFSWGTKDGITGIVANGTNYGGSMGLCMSSVEETIYFFMRDNDNVSAGITTTIAARDTWYHFVGTYNSDSGLLSFYKGGVLINTVTLNATNNFDTTNWTMGGGSILSGNATQRYFEGRIDDVRIYNHELSLREIRSLWKAKIIHHIFNLTTNGVIPTNISDFAVQPSYIAASSLYNQTYKVVGLSSFDTNLQSDTLQYADDSFVQSLKGDITFAFWIYSLDLATPNRQNPWGKAYAGEGAVTLEPTGQLNFYMGYSGGETGGTYTTSSFAGAVTEDVWIHIACTREITTSNMLVKWYKNGAYQKTDTLSLTYTPVSAGSGWNLKIGDQYTNPINGYLDDFRFYVSALTADDILETYHNRMSSDNKGSFHA